MTTAIENAANEMLAALRAVMRCARGELERPLTQRQPWPEAERLIRAAFKKAGLPEEGGAAAALDVAISYRGSKEDGYIGLYTLPGDLHWRRCNDANGDLAICATSHEAEAMAGHHLVADLRKA